LTVSSPPKPPRVAPLDLERFIETLPFLGSIVASRTVLAAGEMTELLLIYEVGASGLADSGRLKITFKFYSDWGEPQTHDPRAANFVRARVVPRPSFAGESDATVQRLGVKYDPKGHERPYQKAIIVDLIDGYLRPGDRIEVCLGDRSQGGPGTRVQTFVEDAFKLRAYVDVTGTSRLAAVPGDTRLTIGPGVPARLHVVTPRLAGRGAPVPIVVRVDDAWGNPCPNPGDVVILELRHGARVVACREAQWVNSERSARASLTIADAGEYRLHARARSLSLENSVPLTVKSDAPLPFGAPRPYFADLHVHSHDTVGTNSTASNLHFARDLAGLDVLGYTVNDFQITDRDWDSAVGDLRRFHEDGRFVCFPGTEWCGNSAVGGDHNVIFLDEEVRFPRDANGASLRSFEWHEDMKAAAPVPGLWPLSRLYAAYEDAPERFLLIPHVGGRRAILDWHHPDLERLVELASSWGHFDWLYRDALARGYRVGASASGDEHRGRPGGGAPGASIFGVRGGLTGVLAPALNRRDIGEALRRRHTWATTGERNVALLSYGDAVQGDEVDSSNASSIRYQLFGHHGWEHVALRDDVGELWQRDLHEELGFAPNRLRLRWGGARVKDRYRWATWKIELQVSNATVLAWTTRGFEHPEERATVAATGRFVIDSATHGDADELELQLDELVGAEIAINATITAFDGTVASAAPLDFRGADLLEAGAICRELGGVDLFFAIERITAETLPVTLEGEVRLPTENGAARLRPIYLFARERGDAKVWTSPIFLRTS
jgi:hypothetical protein